MKKTFSIVVLFTLLFVLIFSVSVNAAVNLDTLTITTDKTIVNPDLNVTINFNFGQPLGAYTFDIDFDDALLEYVSSTGVTSASATGDTVTAFFTDLTGGSAPSSSMSVTFKAKTGITTSNPTQFLITATGMANPDGSVQFEDITTPITKDITVEPAYVDYNITVEYTEPIIKDEEHPINVRISSTMGRYYDHLRLIAEVTKPDNSTFQLFGTDAADLEHDVILSGWGDPAGFGLGGTVNQVYNFRGVFSEDGEYTLTLKLIDRDSSDAVIASKTATFRVGEVVSEIEETEISEEQQQEQQEVLPTTHPKTGINMYLPFSAVALVSLAAYSFVSKKH